MNPQELSEYYVSLALDILRQQGVVVSPAMKVLDFGCGNGEVVRCLRNRGIQAYGCDIALPGDLTPETQQNIRVGVIRSFAEEKYRIPFDDGEFDIVLSNQVFEHVQDYKLALSELRRITAPGGVGFHLFPSRYRILEPHVFVPFATILQNKTWLNLWAILGIRNQFQRQLGWRETVASNARFLTEQTNYLTKRALRREFSAHFDSCEFVEWMRLGAKIPLVNRIVGVRVVLPFVFGWLTSTLKQRWVFVRRADKVDQLETALNQDVAMP